ncbi:E3 ubiquitin-protein ligase hel2-like [Aristolochia californica]|uniref:E3 ubiquitin-protein ligase hel2-like n=1 Tax=Aristolochia californica TaxID=171875 RepID=UPI0035E2C19C
MEDCCAVCAEPLEWVAYGPCGHREVCSTCVVRLRFVLDDRRCCLCKTESAVVFVTKALGDYTTPISDFSIFRTDAAEGRVGKYWYHEDTQSFFDDTDHYQMIKAMCRLSCRVCDKLAEEEGNEGLKRRAKYRNIEQLKGHLFHKHKLFMCSLCLEGRKVFICEQKLYTRAQLSQHISTGDSVVDGSEEDRGGFMGHPMCEFCRNPFYGDNELYMHMSTEHYTCHICQRQNPGQYEYYKNYNDLEIHFRNEHFLCENEACLAKKFLVFQSEAEMKRHTALEHGGHMSRSKRNAALQIPISFRCRRSNEQDQRRSRGRGIRRDSADNQLSLAIQSSLETANAEDAARDSSSNAQIGSIPGVPTDVDDVLNPFELLTVTSDVEPSARYLQAVSQSSRNSRLEESSFPPLPMVPSSGTPKPAPDSEAPGKDTMAARLRQRNKGTVRVLNSAQSSPWSNNVSSSNYPPIGCSQNPGLVSSSSASPTISWPAINQLSSSSSSQAKPVYEQGHLGSNLVSLSRKSKSMKKGVSHSFSAPNLVERGGSSSNQSSEPSLKVEEIHSANRSLVERIRAGLGMDENKYTAFKEMSAEFRRGEIGTFEYLAYVEQFGLSHLVLELARLCPDPHKQRELIETYNANFLILENGSGSNSREIIKFSKSKGKAVENNAGSGKGKTENGPSKDKGNSDSGANSSKDTLADTFLDSIRKLQSNYKPTEEVEVLPKDGYRTAKGKLKARDQAEVNSLNRQLVESGNDNKLSSNKEHLSQNLGDGVNSKQRRKTSKFHRVRLGDGSPAALFDLGQSDMSPEHEEPTSGTPPDGLPVRGVWRNGGGQKLKAIQQRDS